MTTEQLKCPGCDRVYRTDTESPCNCESECLGRDLFRHHVNVGEPDVDERVTYQCPHGIEYTQFCKGCGHELGSWGYGAAGFGDLCGCAES